MDDVLLNALQDLIAVIFFCLYPLFLVGPLLTIFLCAFFFQLRFLRYKIVLSFFIILLLAVQLIGCYYVFPLDLLPYRKDIVVKTVAVENYSISLVQDPDGGEYTTYFRILDSNGRDAVFYIDVDSFKIWRVKINQSDHRIYFNASEYTRMPYIDTLKMTINNGDHGVEKPIASFFEAQNQV